MTRPYPWKCEFCGERSVHPFVLPEYTVEMEHDGRKYEVSVSDLDVSKCTSCGEIAFDSEADRRLSDGLRQAAGLLQPYEIRASREALQLTQKEMANYLKIAEATLYRWETGVQIQQRSSDLMLRAFFAVPEFRSFLRAPESVQGPSALTPIVA